VQPNDVVPYGQKAPGLEKHHPLPQSWSRDNIESYPKDPNNRGYRPPKEPTIALTKEQHAKFHKENGKNFNKVKDPRKMQKLINNLEKVGVPKEKLSEYYRKLNQYQYGGQMEKDAQSKASSSKSTPKTPTAKTPTPKPPTPTPKVPQSGLTSKLAKGAKFLGPAGRLVDAFQTGYAVGEWIDQKTGLSSKIGGGLYDYFNPQDKTPRTVQGKKHNFRVEYNSQGQEVWTPVAQ